MEEIAKSHIDLKTQMSAAGDAIKVPGEGASEEELAAFREQMGVPKTADDYNLKDPVLYEGMQVNEDFVKWFKDTAHEVGMNSKQTNALYDGYNAMQRNLYEAGLKQVEAKKAQAEETLRSEWKNDYDANLEKTRGVIRALGIGEGLKAEGLADVLGNSPTMARALFSIAGNVLDDSGAPVRGMSGGKSHNTLPNGQRVPSYKTPETEKGSQ
jgi:hypothetical protein